MSRDWRLVRRPRARRPQSSRPRAAPGSLLTLLLLTVLTACSDPAPTRATLSVASALTGDTAGFARAIAPRPFAFPADHGPHPEFRTEWWYFTGNLTARDGRDFGFQLTFFRNALRADADALASPWATRQAYMAHFALTDVAGGGFHAFERFDRGALGLAGAERGPVRVWVGDWEAQLEAGASEPTFRIRAGADDVSLDLALEAVKSVVLQGEDGLSRKGPEPGNASYYYSHTRLRTVGSVTVEGVDHTVSGLSWLDREWSTSALSGGLVGWDWFALQLDDGTELMVYRLREDDGGTAPFSAGTFVRGDGTAAGLEAADFVLEETGTWTNAVGDRYPAGWRIRVPELDLDVRVQPRLPGQELDLAFRYWEGAVTVEGRRSGRAVSGRGYVELTGYAGAPGP